MLIALAHHFKVLGAIFIKEFGINSRHSEEGEAPCFSFRNFQAASGGSPAVAKSYALESLF